MDSKPFDARKWIAEQEEISRQRYRRLRILDWIVVAFAWSVIVASVIWSYV